jgi:hypothetical protein
MSVIRINRLTMAEAEDLVATLWRVFEEQRIATPRLHLFAVGETLDVEIAFHGERDAALVQPIVSRGVLAAIAG